MLTYTRPEVLDSGLIVARTIGTADGPTREPGIQFIQKRLDTNGTSFEGSLRDTTRESGADDID